MLLLFTEATNEVQQGSETAKLESVFKNSEPIREDQIQNAIKFLSHPRVRGSPVIHRRSFLERKGLTKEEIDEAFRRVPVKLSLFFTCCCCFDHMELLFFTFVNILIM